MFHENFENLRTDHFRHTYRGIPFGGGGAEGVKISKIVSF